MVNIVRTYLISSDQKRAVDCRCHLRGTRTHACRDDCKENTDYRLTLTLAQALYKYLIKQITMLAKKVLAKFV